MPRIQPGKRRSKKLGVHLRLGRHEIELKNESRGIRQAFRRPTDFSGS